ASAVTQAGAVKYVEAKDLDLSYRHSVFSGGTDIITSLRVKLVPGNPEDIRSKMDDLMGRRRDKQPLEYPSAGSTFKRPEGYFAAALIEQCGLKGASVGGAQVSQKHSGFVINTGSATAADILGLIAHVRAVVLEKTGVYLETEVEFLGM
ncbi:MAG: UDP-N-acetylenolpyruvoylglucosamine reductase, partial [Clostridia bacterium]|nr:UDP-N-acetylenolpyruvoylglucosamine reductase [Clostridia bacterium]